jgi:gluconate 2-dehydrogenase gamma chain
MKLIRRDFLRALLISLGSTGLLGTKGRVYALIHAQENSGEAAPGCRFFNSVQALTLEAICDQIIPPDDFPGAKANGVLYFIDTALSTWAPEHRWDYVAGLQGVDESSHLMFGNSFMNLKGDQQTMVLEAMEKGSAPGRIWNKLKIGTSAGGGKSDAQFFDLLIRYTMQGYYGDPKYGGNRDRASWKMIGYVGHQGH